MFKLLQWLGLHFNVSQEYFYAVVWSGIGYKKFYNTVYEMFPKHKVNGHLGWMATMFKKKKKVYYVVQAHLSKMI